MKIFHKLCIRLDWTTPETISLLVNTKMFGIELSNSIRGLVWQHKQHEQRYSGNSCTLKSDPTVRIFLGKAQALVDAEIEAAVNGFVCISFNFCIHLSLSS